MYYNIIQNQQIIRKIIQNYFILKERAKQLIIESTRTSSFLDGEHVESI